MGGDGSKLGVSAAAETWLSLAPRGRALVPTTQLAPHALDTHPQKQQPDTTNEEAVWFVSRSLEWPLEIYAAGTHGKVESHSENYV